MGKKTGKLEQSLKFQKASPGVKYLEECLLRKVFVCLPFTYLTKQVRASKLCREESKDSKSETASCMGSPAGLPG